LHSVNCYAQERDTEYTVAERFSSVFRPEGFPVGSMRLYPRLGGGWLRSDNVFASDILTESDWAATALAELVLEADNSLYTAELGGQAELGRFNDFESNDYDNARFWLSTGKTLKQSNVLLDVDFASLNEPRTSVDAPQLSTQLTRYRRSTIAGAYTYTPGRRTLLLDGSYRNLDFDDVDTLAGPVSNADRSRSEVDFGVRLGYEISDSYGFFVEPRISSIQYDQKIDDNGFERSRDGYDFRLGADLRFTGLLTGEFYFGYLSRTFDDPNFSKATGPSFGAQLDWFITSLMTLRLGAERTTEPTTIVNASSTTNTSFAINVDYELLRNLILGLGVERRNEVFEGIPREDEVTLATAVAEYRVNRNWLITAAYRHHNRHTEPSDLGGRVFEINGVSIDLTYQL
jgi:hypothetical protein